MWTELHAVALTSVFNALNETGIEWMVLRNYEGLPYHNRSKDIDLIVEESRLEESLQLIHAALKSQGFQFYSAIVYGGACAVTFFKVKNNECQSIKIDVMHSINWRGADILTFEQVYCDSNTYNNFRIPNDSISAFLLFVKTLLMGGRLKVTYVSEISCAINNHPEKFHYFLNDTFGEDVAKKIWQLLLSGQVDAALNIGKSARRKTWSRFFKKKLLLTTKGTVVHFSREIFRRSFRSPASMISVVGPDGVGKTTFIELLKQELSRTLVKDADAILVNHFRPNILPNIKKLLSGKNYDPSTEDFTNPHRAKPAGVFSSFIRLTYYWLDYVLGYWLDTRRKCAQQNVFIFDRYFYDFIVDPRRSRINLPAWIRKAFLALTPQPDLVLFLDCDADIVFARKQELSRDEIERQLVEYRSLAMAFPQRFVRLDAQQPPEVSCHQALVHIIERSFRLL